ncbi:MAG TPA: transketolase [Phycisphaerae bacterium]|nr:transketolase [Phycisphaerae bacterium]
MAASPEAIEKLSIDTIRTLAMDAVQQANSGHPGAPMALAPLAYTLYTRYLRVNPADPHFPNRDRFVLSAGHASMLLYASLHLSGFDVTLDDIKAFRQLGSATPGHPEYGHTPGVETTTGPLGQGAGNSVGMAIAQKWLAAHFNRDGHPLVDYRIFALLGDGCMMEGITGEAASLAGHLKLDNLVWFYDSNRVTIEGHTDLAYSDDPLKRFEGYGWFVQQVDDIEDRTALCAAIDAAIAMQHRPSLVVVRSIIGRGAPTRQDTAKAHGEPLGADEIAGAKKFYNWPGKEPFFVPAEVHTHWTEPARRRGAELASAWNDRYAAYAAAYPDLAAEWQLIQRRALPDGWEKAVPEFPADAKGLATRASGGKTLVALGKRIPWLMGGAADLAPSTKSLLEDTTAFAADTPHGRNLHFGIREHAMAAACNGMALSGLRPYGASFLVFTDYARPSIRLAAMMHQPVIFVFTHDSIGVGEDGPTHQPIEHVAALRAIPNLDVFRPGDANEAAMAWRHALSCSDRPVLLALTRQNLPTIDRQRFAPAEGVLRGGYVVADSDGEPEVILIGTGSELQHCMTAYATLSSEGLRARVVSLPCWELFERQDAAYREEVLPAAVTARVAIEAGVALGWERYIGSRGVMLGLRDFGASGPYNEVMKHFGITADAVLLAARELLAQRL